MMLIMIWVLGGVVVLLGGVMLISFFSGGGDKRRAGRGRSNPSRSRGGVRKSGGDDNRHVHVEAVQGRGSASGGGEHRSGVVGHGRRGVGRGSEVEAGPELVRGIDSNAGVAGEAGDLIGIDEADIGSRVLVGGVGGRDVEFVIDQRSRYEVDGENWFELSGRSGIGRIYVELVEEGSCVVDFGDAKMGLEAVGLTEGDLVRMDEGNGEGEGLEYEGSVFAYEDSFECCYYENCRGGGERYYSWEFIEDDGGRVLWVEKYEGEGFEASVGYVLDASDFVVYRG